MRKYQQVLKLVKFNTISFQVFRLSINKDHTFVAI